MANSEPPVVVITHQKKITRDELLQNIKDNQGKCYFMMRHDWYNIHSTDLSDKVEQMIDDAYLLMELTYKPMTVDGDDIIFLVTVNNTAEYLLGGQADDEDE